MSSSKRDFEEAREFCIVEMSREFYQEHNELLSPPNATLKAAYIIGESHKGDKEYEQKFEVFKQAQMELREYEFLKRYKRLIKED